MSDTPEIVIKARAIVADYKELQARPKGIFRGQRTEELDLAEAVVELYERAEKAVDATLEKILCASDDQIAATLRADGHDPKDVATIARQAGEIAILRVDLAQAAARPEERPLEQTTLKAGAEVVQRAIAGVSFNGCCAVAEEVYRVMRADDARYAPSPRAA